MYRTATPRRSELFFGMHLLAQAGTVSVGEADGAVLGEVADSEGRSLDLDGLAVPDVHAAARTRATRGATNRCR